MSRYIDEERFQARLANYATGILILMVFLSMILLERRFRRELEMQNAELEQGVRERTRKLEESSWLQSGQGRLSETMQGDKDLTLLCREILSTLAPYVEASIGAMYLRHGDQYRMVASYAFHERKWLDTVLEPGQGMLGQAIQEKEMRVISQVPADYVRIQSALGEAAPTSLVVLPLVRSGEVEGAIELGFLGTVSRASLDLLRQVSAHIAVNIHSGQSRMRMKELLEETRNQAEELQTQKEELRTINEELEEQARTLQISENRLREQSAELQLTNETLQKRSVELERERTQVDRKNQELVQATQLVEEKARDLERTSAYKTEFLAVMSHELRTPLNSIMLLSQLLADNDAGNLTTEQIDQLHTINHGGQDLLNLINQILDLSKIEAGKFEIHLEPVDLQLLAQDLRRFFSMTAQKKGLEFSVTVAPGVTTLMTDPLRLGQVLKNFLSNAFKFTSRGLVALEIAPASGNFVARREDLRQRPVIAFHVRDSGMGIPAEKQDKIFEAFEQLDSSISRKFGGTGLGLSISRELARLLGGEIHLLSQEGAGSTFSIYLPLAPSGERALPAHRTETERPAPPPVAATRTPVAEAGATLEGDVSTDRDDPVSSFAGAETRPPAAPPAPRLLIIEDDVSLAQQLASIARARGQDCRLAHSARDGLALAREWKPDGIILDLILPDGTGEGVLAELKGDPETWSIPVHVMSGKEDIEEASTAESIGVARKPLMLPEVHGLLDTLRRYHRDQAHRVLVVAPPGASTLESSDFPDQVVEIVRTHDFDDVMTQVSRTTVHCIVLGPGYDPSLGQDLVRKLKTGPGPSPIPIILLFEEEAQVAAYDPVAPLVDRIILQKGEYRRRLIDETQLFMNRVGRVGGRAPVDRPRPASKLSGKQVLVVDDDPRNVYSVSCLLKSWGVSVEAATNGVEALKMLGGGKPFDLVLMDIMMPEMDGLQATRQIRADSRLRDLPVIALTAKAMKTDREECLQAGANDYLPKPIDRSKLRSAIEVWLS